MRPAHALRPAALLLILFVSTAASAEELPWGPEANGLRAAVTVTPAEVRLGEEFVIRISIKNVSDRPTNVYYRIIFPALTLDIRDEKGERVPCIEGAERYNAPMPDAHYHLLPPGETYAAEIRGRARYVFVPAAKRPANEADRKLRLDFHDVISDAVRPGKFTATLRLVVDAKLADAGRKFGVDPVWTGELASNAATFAFRPMTRGELDANAARIEKGTYEEQRAAIAIASANADRGSVKALMALLSTGEGPLREAANALMATADASVLSELKAIYRKSLAEPKRDPGAWPAALIGAIRWLEPDPAKTVAFIVSVLKSDAPVEARSAAMWSLWNERRPEFVAAVMDLAKKPEPRMQYAAIDVLAGFGGNKLPIDEEAPISGLLIEILKTDPEASVRIRAAGALRDMSVPTVVPALVEALKDPDVYVNITALTSLGTRGRLEDIPAIEAWAKDKSPDRQKIAADTIKTIRQIHRAATP